jgi:hypothetical protein
MVRQIARKEYQNGRWGVQSASLSWDSASLRWIVGAWDCWAHQSLTEAKVHYRSIGQASA